MTKDELLDAAKELHYSEKLDLAQKLIQIARKDLEQITCQFQPNPVPHVTNTSAVEPVPVNHAQPSAPAVAELSFEDIIERLKKLKCKKEKTMLNSIMAMFQFRGGITDENAKKIIHKMINKKILSISDNGSVSWN